MRMQTAKKREDGERNLLKINNDTYSKNTAKLNKNKIQTIF